MPSRVVGGTATGSRGKARYRSKHFYRKSNSNASNRCTRRQDTPSSSPDPRLSHILPSTRLSSKGGNTAHTNLPSSLRYNQRKPWVGIFGAERESGNITILRRQDANKPKGVVPTWLAHTFGSLPNKHPLKETANNSSVMGSMTRASDDDDNPFAYQPPSPSQTPSTPKNLTFPYIAQRVPTKTYSTLSHRRGLSSVPFAPPTFIEPTYEDRYQDTTMPLNDFHYDFGPGNPVYLTGSTIADRNSEPTSCTSRAAPQFPSPQRISSPIFLPGGYSPPLIATTPVFDTISSDDIPLYIPTHSNFLSPETDEIQDALCANHSFVTSMYANSPTGSFKGFPLYTLVGSRESSPYHLASPSRNIPTPDTIHRKIRTPRKGLSPQALVQPRPASSDIYKSRLLAYATTVVDHMSSSGDEASVHQQTNERVYTPETERAASSPVTRNASSLGLLDEKALIALHEDSEPFRRSNDHTSVFGMYRKALDPDNWIEPKLAKSLLVAEGRLDQSATGIHTSSPEFDTRNSDRGGDRLDQMDFGDNFDLANTYLEDQEHGFQSEGIMADLEQDRPLVSEYEVMQAEYDTPAADEPSDDEGGPTEQCPVTTSQESSEVEDSVLQVGNAASAIPKPSKRNPKIQPFPMKVPPHSLAHDTTVPVDNLPVLTRLSPEFTSRPSIHVRPSPFAALLKKRFKNYPNAVGPKGQEDTTVVEDKEDEIESWSG